MFHVKHSLLFNGRKNMKKKQSAARIAYMKERRRIQNYLSRKKYEGYENIDFELPEIPNRITQKKVKELKEIKPKTIKAHLRKVTYPQQPGKQPALGFMNIPQTKEFEGEIQTYEKLKKPKQEKEEKKEEKEPSKDTVLDRSTEAKLVVDGFIFRVQLELPKGADNLVVSLITTMVEQEGYIAVANALEAMPDDIRSFLKRYGSEFDFIAFSTEFLDYLEKELAKSDSEMGENKGWYRSQIEDIIESALVTGTWDEGAAI